MDGVVEIAALGGGGRRTSLERLFRNWITRIVLFNPSTNPSETLFSGRQYAAIPSQWRSIMGASSSYGWSRYYLSAAFQPA
jgi:hypothetical protein